MREAQAELNQARLAVAKEVASMYHDHLSGEIDGSGLVFVVRDYGIFVTTGFKARFLAGATIPADTPYEPQE